MPESIAHLRLGRADYSETLVLQRTLHTKRVAGEIDDVVISVEHNPVFTIGRTGSRKNLLASEADCTRVGIDIVDIERGGDITYHGPGQLILYPILDLRSWGRDIHAYIRGLEEIMIRTLAQFGVSAQRRSGAPGTWVGSRKIGSIGVHVRRWVTMHGLALNVDVDPAHFAMIRPCGMDIETVSVGNLIQRPPTVEQVLDTLLPIAESVWERDIFSIEGEELMRSGTAAVLD